MAAKTQHRPHGALAGRRYGPSFVRALPTITTGPFKNNTGTLLTSLTVPNVLVISLTTKTIVLSLTSQVTHASTAVLSIASAALAAGSAYLVLTFDNDGNPAGVETYTAA